MRTPQRIEADAPAPYSVTDAIGEAAQQVVERPWVLAFPLVGNLVAWFGLGVTVRGGTAIDLPPLPFLGRLLTSDVVHVVAAATPNLLSGADRELFWTPFDERSLRIASPVLGGTVWVVAVVVAMVVALSYRLVLADIALGVPTRARRILDLLPGAIRTSLIAALVCIGVGTVAMSPVLTLSWVGTSLDLDPWPAIAWGLMFVTMVGAVLFAFVADAIALGQRDPLLALRQSVLVAQDDLFGVLRLLLYRLVVRFGLPVAAFAIAATPIGLFLGVLAHAFIGTCLVLAGTLFFQARRGNVPAEATPIALAPKR